MARVVFFLIGCLLAVTAVLKLWMLLTDPFADVHVGLQKEILWLNVAFEFGLAWLNFRSTDHDVVVFVDIVVFSTFALFLSVRRLMGYGSCGCSGALDIPMWVFGVLDVSIVVWLVMTTWRKNSFFQGLKSLQRLWGVWTPDKRGLVAGAGLFIAIVLGLQLPLASQVRAAVLGEPEIQGFFGAGGELFLDRSSPAEIKIWNYSSWPAKIVGVSKSCRCIEFRENPTSRTIPAHNRISLPLTIKPLKFGPLQQRVELFLDHPEQFRVRVDVFGSVKGE